MPDLSPAAVPSTLAEQLVLLSQITKAFVGLAIAYIAYRGYRRNRSRPMFFISLGFVLVLGLPFALLLVYLAVPGAPELTLTAINEVSQVIGLLVILYALRMDP